MKVFRRIPIQDYDLSLLFTNSHTERYGIEPLVDVVLRFVTSLNHQIKELKTFLEMRGKALAQEYWTLVETRITGTLNAPTAPDN